MRKEQRWDWALGSWVAKYDVNQEYDKRGNRTRYDKNVQGSAGDYGIAYDLGYTFDGSSLLTAITDADNGAYSASVTCDANNNITSIDEVLTGTGHTPQNNHVYTYFDVDDLNRVTAYRTKNYNGLNWMWEKRAHQYDGLGRATKSTYKNWIDGTTEPAGTSIEHTYDKQGQHLQNYDGSSTYGATWNWSTQSPVLLTRHSLRGPNADTASQTGYNVATNASPQERTFLNPTTEGDRRHLWGQGRPMAKDSSGSGSNWATGLKSNVQNINQVVVESRLDYSGTVSATVDRGTDAREKGRIGIFGSQLSYAGSYGRVTSEAIGRDINPLGRGDGNAYVAGWINLGRCQPILPTGPKILGFGNSANNSPGFDTPCPDCHFAPPGQDPYTPAQWQSLPRHNSNYNGCPSVPESKAQSYKVITIGSPSSGSNNPTPPTKPVGALTGQGPDKPPHAGVQDNGLLALPLTPKDCFDRALERHLLMESLIAKEWQEVQEKYVQANAYINWFLSSWDLNVISGIHTLYLLPANPDLPYWPGDGVEPPLDSFWDIYYEKTGMGYAWAHEKHFWDQVYAYIGWLRCTAWNDLARGWNTAVISYCKEYNTYAKQVNQCLAQSGYPYTPLSYKDCSPNCFPLMPELDCGTEPKQTWSLDRLDEIWKMKEWVESLAELGGIPVKGIGGGLE